MILLLPGLTDIKAMVAALFITLYLDSVPGPPSKTASNVNQTLPGYRSSVSSVEGIMITRGEARTLNLTVAPGETSFSK